MQKVGMWTGTPGNVWQSVENTVGTSAVVVMAVTLSAGLPCTDKGQTSVHWLFLEGTSGVPEAAYGCI